MKTIKLSQWAKANNYTYTGAYLKFKRGGIPNSFQDKEGSIFIEILDPLKPKTNNCIIYARCSSSKQKEDAVRQLKRLQEFANAQGFVIIDSYIEIASGMNDDRPVLNKILDRSDYSTLVVENKDRLTRFGFNYIKKLLKNKEINITVMNESSDETDLTTDLISIITSFCGRIYGKRKSKAKKDKLINTILDKHEDTQESS